VRGLLKIDAFSIIVIDVFFWYWSYRCCLLSLSNNDYERNTVTLFIAYYIADCLMPVTINGVNIVELYILC